MRSWGGEPDLCFVIGSYFESVAARLKTLSPLISHRFDGGRRRNHRPACDRVKSDSFYDIRSPPTLATFFSLFSGRILWTFPRFDSMIRPVVRSPTLDIFPLNVFFFEAYSFFGNAPT